LKAVFLKPVGHLVGRAEILRVVFGVFHPVRQAIQVVEGVVLPTSNKDQHFAVPVGLHGLGLEFGLAVGHVVEDLSVHGRELLPQGFQGDDRLALEGTLEHPGWIFRLIQVLQHCQGPIEALVAGAVT